MNYYSIKLNIYCVYSCFLSRRTVFIGPSPVSTQAVGCSN